MTTYHTALATGHLTAGPEIDRFTLPNGSVAFAHDITLGLPAEFAACDVFYADFPWRHGFAVFNDRAGVADGRSYASFMHKLSGVLASIRAPLFMAGGKDGLKKLPTPDWTRSFRLHHTEAILAGWNVAPPAKVTTSDALLAELAERYACGGDFFCGYGKTALAFHGAGKRFVASDYVRHCIGVLKSRVA